MRDRWAKYFLLELLAPAGPWRLHYSWTFTGGGPPLRRVVWVHDYRNEEGRLYTRSMTVGLK